MIKKVEILLEVDDKGTAKMVRFADKSKRALNRASTGAGDFDKQLKNIDKNVGMLTSGLGGLGGLVGAAFTVRAVSDFVGNLDQANQKLYAYQVALKTASGGAGAAATENEWLNKTVDALNVNLEASRSGYSKLLASTKEAGISTADTRDIFQGAAMAASALSLSQDDTNGMLRAFYQIASKGKVQAEELRGQMGERVPGAFGLAAKAMGMTTAELDKALEKGEVYADVFLPKFARALKEKFEQPAMEAAEGPRAAVNRLNNAFTRLGEELGKNTNPLMMTLRNIAADAADALAEVTRQAGLLSSASGAKNLTLPLAAGAGQAQLDARLNQLLVAQRSIRITAGASQAGKQELARLDQEIGQVMAAYAGLFSGVVDGWDMVARGTEEAAAANQEAAKSAAATDAMLAEHRKNLAAAEERGWKQLADAELKNIAEREKARKDAGKAEQKAISDEVAFNLKAMGSVEDSWMLHAENRKKGSADVSKYIREQEAETVRAQEDYALAMATATGDSLRVREIEHQRFIREWKARGIEAGNAEALWLAQGGKKAKSTWDQMLRDWSDTNKIMEETNQLTWESIRGTVKSGVHGIIHGEDGWNSLPDAFRSTGDLLIAIAEDIASQIATALALKGLAWLVNFRPSSGGGGFWDGILGKSSSGSGVGGALGTVSSIASIASGASKVAGWLGLTESAAPAIAKVLPTPGWAIGPAAETAAGGGAGAAAASAGSWGIGAGQTAALTPTMATAATMGPIAAAMLVGTVVFPAMAEQMSPEEAMDRLGRDLGTLGEIKAAVGDWNVDTIADTAHHLDLMATRAGLSFEQVDLLTLGVTGLEEQMADAAATSESSMDRLGAALQNALDVGDYALAEQIRAELAEAQAEYEQTATDITNKMAELNAIGQATGFDTTGFGLEGAAAIEAGQVIPEVEASLRGLIGAYVDADGSSNNLTIASRKLASGLDGLVGSLDLGEDTTSGLNTMVDDMVAQFLNGDIQAAELSTRLNDELVGALVGATEAGDLTAESIRGIAGALSDLQKTAGINLAIEATWMDGHGEGHRHGGWAGDGVDPRALPHFKTGKSADEIPAVIHRGEAIFSVPEVRRWGAANVDILRKGPGALSGLGSTTVIEEHHHYDISINGLSIDDPRIAKKLVRKLDAARARRPRRL